MDSLPQVSSDAWQLLGALLSGTVGAKLLDYWIRRREAKTQSQEQFSRMTMLERAEEERLYRTELRQENKEIRETLKQFDARYRECEEDRAHVRAELYLNRQKLQVLQLRVDELEEIVKEMGE